MQVKKNAAWAPEQTLAYWINRASRRLLKLHEGRLRPLGLGMHQLPVLIALEEEEALSQKELAARARVEQPTMAEMLARMERDGLLERAPNPDDGRGRLWSLTPTARARLPKARAALLLGEADASSRLRKSEKAEAIRLLRTVVETLEDADG